MAHITEILQAISRGDPQATEELLPRVYDELRRLAAQKLSQERPGQTLQATALVHEAYLRLFGAADASFDGRAHFFAAAAEAMRRILIEKDRRKQAQKRGGERDRVALSTADLAVEQGLDDLLILDEALEELAEAHADVAELVQFRLFGGLGNHEAAAVLGISERTARRNWAFARAWFVRRLENSEDE